MKLSFRITSYNVCYTKLLRNKGNLIMHEVGITRSIVEICEETARRQGAKVVRSVTVEIGEP